ncbi:hypothetical protein [Streptomyces sp. NPDC003952]
MTDVESDTLPSLTREPSPKDENVLLRDAPPAATLSDVSPGVLRDMTWSTRKSELYAIDSYFREGCWIFAEDMPEMLGVALCILKPEAVVGRRLRPALDALSAAGFKPVDVIRFRYDRLSIREVYRYQFNRAAPDLIAAMDLVLPSTDSVCLVLRDEHWVPGMPPASVRLNSLKGPSDMSLRRPQHLRYQLGVVNGLLNFMHVSDELIDVVREIAVLCDVERQTLTRERIRSEFDAVSETLSVFDDLELTHPTHDFDLDASWLRLAGADGPVGKLARQRAKGTHIPLGQLLQAAREASLQGPLHWDLLTVLTHALEVMTIPGITPMVPTITTDWVDSVG